MVKTTVYIPDSLKEKLRALATREGRSEAQLVREALQRLVESAEPPRPQLPLFGSGQADLAERVDEALQGFGE